MPETFTQSAAAVLEAPERAEAAAEPQFDLMDPFDVVPSRGFETDILEFGTP